MGKKEKRQSQKQSPPTESFDEVDKESADPMSELIVTVGSSTDPTAGEATPTSVSAPTSAPPDSPATVASPRLVETADAASSPDFKAKTTLRQDAVSKIIYWIKDQKTLFDAFLVALSFHVVMFPVLWVAGWALPWPKPPVVTTIIEFDLQDWMKSGKPKKVIEFRDPELNE